MSVIVCTEAVRDRIRECIPVVKKGEGRDDGFKGDGWEPVTPAHPEYLGISVFTLPEGAFEGCTDMDTGEPANLVYVSRRDLLELLMPHWGRLKAGKMRLVDIVVPRGRLGHGACDWSDRVLEKRGEW
jgi:hypothetical protein